jgi:NADH-quinone oxidoreductase subunit D
MFTTFMWAFRERSQILKLLEDVSGSRMFYVNLRLGGLNAELPNDFRDRSYKLADYLEEKIRGYPDFLDSDPVFMERTKNIGVLPEAEAINYGVSGPVLRAAGVEEDTRRSKPYYFYDKIKFHVPRGSKSDAYDRYRVRYEEMLESIKIVRQSLDMMPETGRVTGLPIKIMGPNANPEPILLSREVPRGEGMIYMIPDKQKPYRISFRSPSFINLAAMPRMCRECRFADIFSILGSIDIVLAEIDR